MFVKVSLLRVSGSVLPVSRYYYLQWCNNFMFSFSDGNKKFKDTGKTLVALSGT